MIARTVLEWGSLPYGEGENQVPEWAADRVASVAKASTLGGEDGTRIVTLGRKELRVAQVVGVVAADGCTLEILPKIDFSHENDDPVNIGRIRRQLVHMLAVALDIEVASGSITTLGWQQENLLEILIGLFVRKLADLTRQGMPRRYVGCEDELPMLRGRLDVTRQFTVLAANVQKLACRYDALSPNIALNQIVKAAVLRLMRVARSQENQRYLRELAFTYAEIADVSVTSLPWHNVVLDRTNSGWHELIELAKLLLGDRFQTTSLGGGRGYSLLFEMNILFEEYIAKMLKRALRASGLTVHAQSGRLYCLEDMDTHARRFMTMPDILVARGPWLEMIIDTKWKRLIARIDDPKQGMSQADVYQMMAYGQVYGCERLLLLYPHHGGLGKAEGVIACHRVTGSNGMLMTATIDISARRGIVERLRDLYDQAGQQLARAT